MAVAMEAAPVEEAVETAEDVASDALRLQTFYWTLYIGYCVCLTNIQSV